MPNAVTNIIGQTTACKSAEIAYKMYRAQLAGAVGAAAPYIQMANSSIRMFQKSQYDQVMGLLNGAPNGQIPPEANPQELMNAIKNTKCDFLKEMLGMTDTGLLSDIGDALKAVGELPGLLTKMISDDVKKLLEEGMKLALGPLYAIFDGLKKLEEFLDDLGVYDALDMLAKAEACLMSVCGKSAAELKVPGTDMFGSFYYAKQLQVDPEKRSVDFAPIFNDDIDAYNKYNALYSKFKQKMTPVT